MRQFLSFLCGALVTTALTVGMLTVPALSAPTNDNTSTTSSSLDNSAQAAASDKEKAAAKKAAKAKKKKAAKKAAKAKKKKAAAKKKAKRIAKVKRVKKRALKALKKARTRAGMSYRYGSSGPRAFDCSGLVRWAYAKAGKKLPHSSGAQAAATKRVKKPRKGDLVFFHNGGRVYHVGLYAGKKKVFHASRPGKPVGKERIWTKSVFYGRA